MKIPFNKPFVSGKELKFIEEAVSSGKISGNGKFTKKCHSFFEEKYGFKNCLLTSSCTDALEMAAILSECGYEDEVIIPSYGFVSTANAFELRGCKIVFADSMESHPNIDLDHVESLINSKTKVLVIIHYAGVACDMDKVMKLVEEYNLILVEDAAQAIDSYYKDKPLGSFGHFSTFSFHETKNIISGEGGLLVINDEDYLFRAEIIWEKGTNRVQFSKGLVNKYTWVDIGSSFLPSEITAAFLYSQLISMENIQQKRIDIWNIYYENLINVELKSSVLLPKIPEYSSNNAHIFYLICKNKEERDELISYLNKEGIMAVFHYLPLHESPYFRMKHENGILANTRYFSDRLLRLPLFYEIDEKDVLKICERINLFFKNNNC